MYELVHTYIHITLASMNTVSPTAVRDTMTQEASRARLYVNYNTTNSIVGNNFILSHNTTIVLRIHTYYVCILASMYVCIIYIYILCMYVMYERTSYNNNS